jgi:anti-sigma B factor antagonist
MLTYQTIKQDGQPSLRLCGALTIYTVAQARSEIPSRMASHRAQVLDLSGIDELDTAGVQLLLWIKRDMAKRGSELTLASHSPAVVEVLDLLKLTATFGDPILLSPSTS